MVSYAFFVGSHPALSAAELAAYISRTKSTGNISFELLPHAVLLNVEDALDIPSLLVALGGTPFVARITGMAHSLSGEDILAALPSPLPLPEKHPVIGVSFFGTHPEVSSPRDVRAIGMDIKHILKYKGMRMAFPQQGLALSSAQYVHEHLPTSGIGIVLMPSPDGVMVGIVEAVQDIQAYTLRDRERPFSDPGRGMLPPKVAQMLLNLSSVPRGGTVYDPFCGSGTIPMEAFLQGHPVLASDVSPTQADRTEKNLQWLLQETNTTPSSILVFPYDIVRYPTKLDPRSVDAVITEGWLGPASSRTPSPSEMNKTFQRVQDMLMAMLKHVRPALKPQATITCIVPAFRAGKRIVHAPFLESLEKSPLARRNLDAFPPPAYTFEHLVPSDWDHPLFRGASQGTLLYGRPDAIVLREIIRLRLR